MPVTCKHLVNKIEGSLYLYFMRRSDALRNDALSGTRLTSREKKMLAIICDDATRLDDWMTVIDGVVSQMENKLFQQLILLRYNERKDQPDVCHELGIEKSTYYNYRSKIIEAIAVMALSENLCSRSEVSTLLDF